MALINGAPCAPALLADAILCAEHDAGGGGGRVLPGGGGLRRRAGHLRRAPGGAVGRSGPVRRAAGDPRRDRGRRAAARAPTRTRSRRSASGSCPGCWATPTALLAGRPGRGADRAARGQRQPGVPVRSPRTATSATSSPTAAFTTAPRRRASTASTLRARRPGPARPAPAPAPADEPGGDAGPGLAGPGDDADGGRRLRRGGPRGRRPLAAAAAGLRPQRRPRSVVSRLEPVRPRARVRGGLDDVPGGDGGPVVRAHRPGLSAGAARVRVDWCSRSARRWWSGARWGPSWGGWRERLGEGIPE